MGNYVLRFYYYSFNWRLASIILTTCVCSATQGFCSGIADRSYHKSANKLLNKVELADTNAAINQFNTLEKITQTAQDPLEESTKFLQSFIDGLNTRYGLSLSIVEACSLIKSNIDTLQITKEEKNHLLISIELFDTKATQPTPSSHQGWLQVTQQSIFFGAPAYFSLASTLFGVNKNKKKFKKSLIPVLAANPEIELPGNCYIGACEAFAGALLCIIPHPAAWTVGIGMMTDGGLRILDGVNQLDQARRLDPNYVPPKFDVD